MKIKIADKSASKTMLMALLALAVPGEMTAQTEKSPLTVAPAVSAPTNNVAELSHGKGEVILFEPKGVVFKPDGSAKRVPMKELTENDLRALLETPKGFKALAEFKNALPRNATSEKLEKALHSLWVGGKTMHQRVQERFDALEFFKTSNADKLRVDKVGSSLKLSQAKCEEYEAQGPAVIALSKRQDLTYSQAKAIERYSSEYQSAVATHKAILNVYQNAVAALTLSTIRLAVGFNWTPTQSNELIPTLSATSALDIERSRWVLRP